MKDTLKGLSLLEEKNLSKVVGLKQTLRAIQNDLAKEVFVANDADIRIINQVISVAKEKNIKVNKVDTMEELGKAANIRVGAATLAIVENN